MLRLPQLVEYHTSELTATCPRSVFHRIRGEAEGSCPTAMFRGLLAGEALRWLHENARWDSPGPAAMHAHESVLHQLETEGRMLTDAVEKNVESVLKEVRGMLDLYIRRFGAKFQRCHLIGCEVPVRMIIDGREFASHLDLLYRDPEGVWGERDALCIEDWKWRDTHPTNHYLARNLQLASYVLAVAEGECLVGEDEWKSWVRFDEWPRIAWTHLPNLKPYGRATVTKDDAGVEREFKRGDDRPINKIKRWVPFGRHHAEVIREQLLDRIRMFEAGFFPMNPDPIGCSVCQSEQWCQRMDSSKLDFS